MDRTQRWFLAVGTVALLVVPAAAQDDDPDPGEEARPAAPPPGPPTISGRDSATASAGQAGMTYDLTGTGARLVVPPGLPIGRSRRMTFAISRVMLRSNDIAPGFRRIGVVMSFDGAIDATSTPVLVSIRQLRDPSRPGQRLVLAMEQPAICDAQHTQPLAGAGGLCSGWTILDARLADGRLSAELPTPGGYRLVFGSVPTEAQGAAP